MDIHSVMQYDMNGQLIREWKSVHEVKKSLGIDINRCVKGEKESMGGYRWAYKIPRDVGFAQSND